jgi:hypothetical protein
MAIQRLRPLQRTPLQRDSDKEIAIRELQQKVNELTERINTMLEKADAAGLSL